MTELSSPEGGELRSFAAPLTGVAGSEPEHTAVRRVPTDKETRAHSNCQSAVAVSLRGSSQRTVADSREKDRD